MRRLNMSITRFKDYIRIINGKVTYCVQGLSANKKNNINRHIECYREFETDIAMCRNLYYRNFTHSFFCFFPGEKTAYYSKNRKEWTYTEDWDEAYLLSVQGYSYATEKDIQNIVSVYPSFIYTARKMQKIQKFTVRKLFDILKIWKEHKECEYFFSIGLFDVCFSKNLYRLSKNNMKKIFNYAKNHSLPSNIKLTYLQSLVKYDIKEEDIDDFIIFAKNSPVKRNDQLYYYLKKQLLKFPYESMHTINRLYSDYFTIIKEMNLDIKDSYHLYPTDLHQRHNKVLEQSENIKRIHKAEEENRIQKNYLKIAEKYAELKTEINGYEIFIPQDIHTIELQADRLNQCLIRCDYIKQVANRNCVLVFVQKKGIPVATAEIKPDGKIGQFRGLNNSVDTVVEERLMFDKWLLKNPIQWEKEAA